MAFKLIGLPQVKKATPNLAKMFAEMEPTPYERPFQMARLEYHQQQYEQGFMRSLSWAKGYCKETKKVYRFNGRHTSTCLLTITPFPANIPITIETFECDTLVDVGNLFQTFDAMASARSSSDINGCYAAAVPSFKNVSLSVISIAVSGIDYQTRGLFPGQERHHTRPSAAERAKKMYDYVDFICWLNRTLTGDHGGQNHSRLKERKVNLRRQATVAAMLSTFEKNKSDASKFWSEVRDDIGLAPEMPTRRLAGFLRIVGVRGGHAYDVSKVVSTREIYVKCIRSWNAWRNQESTFDFRYFPDKPLPDIK